MLIYRVTNTVNGKVYIGKWSHPTPDHRWRLHKSAAKSGSPYYFHRAIRKYGPDAFKLEVIDRSKTADELSEKEKFYIASHQSNDPKKGYNMTLGGEGHNGWKASEAWKKWKSGHSKKFWNDPEYRAKQTQSHKEWWTPERRMEWALQMRGTKCHLGKRHSEQQRKNISNGVLRALAIYPKPSKSVRCIDTNEIFPSSVCVIERLGGNRRNLTRAILKGYRFFGKRFEYAQ